MLAVLQEVLLPFASDTGKNIGHRLHPFDVTCPGVTHHRLELFQIETVFFTQADRFYGFQITPVCQVSHMFCIVRSQSESCYHSSCYSLRVDGTDIDSLCT